MDAQCTFVGFKVNLQVVLCLIDGPFEELGALSASGFLSYHGTRVEFITFTEPIAELTLCIFQMLKPCFEDIEKILKRLIELTLQNLADLLTLISDF